MDGGGFFADDFEPAVSNQGAAAATSRRQPQNYSDDDFDLEGEAALAELEQEEGGLSGGGGRANGAAAASKPAVVGQCIDCSEKQGQDSFFQAFGISVCYDCQRVAKGPGDKYQVITKTKAKDQFLLTDRQLDRSQGGLGCMTKKNPHEGRFNDMRLYLRAQCEEVALKQWGNDEAIFEEKERRTTERLQKSEARKRKAADKLSHGAGFGGNRKAPKAQRAAAVASSAAAITHKHTFPPEEEHEYDEESDMWTKRCACGFEVQYDKW